MASRERTGRGRGRGNWQRNYSWGGSWTNSKRRQYKHDQRNDLDPAGHPGAAIWRRFPEVRIEIPHDFDKEKIRKLCVPYGEIVGSRTFIQNRRKYQETQFRGRDWGNRRFRKDLQTRSEIIATYKFTYNTDEAAKNCADALSGQKLEGHKIETWFYSGEKRCCPRRLSGRTSPTNSHKNKGDLSYSKESSEHDFTPLDHQINPEDISGNSSTDIGSVQISTNIVEGYEIEKCISSNEAINILDGVEIVTPGNFEMLDYSKKIKSSEVKRNEKENRKYEDVVINIEDCESFSNETNYQESNASIENKFSVLNDTSYENTSDDLGIPIEMPNMEFNSILEFLTVTPEKDESVTKVNNVDNEKSDSLNSTLESSNAKKKKKKKQSKEKKGKKEKDKKEARTNERSPLLQRGYLSPERSFSAFKGNWRCQDPSCNSSNTFDEELCTKCKLPCPVTMRDSIKKVDESNNLNKYYLAYAKSCVEIYVQDYKQKRDAMKMTEILNRRFEHGHKSPGKNQKDGVFAVKTLRGWVRGRVIGMCNGIDCSLLHNRATNFDANIKQEDETEIENNGNLNYALLSSSYASHESNYRYNINEEYYEKNVKIPYMEITSSVLEHQIMIEEEYKNETIIKGYLNSIDNFDINCQDVSTKTTQFNEITSSLEHQLMGDENYKNEILIREYLNSLHHEKNQEKKVTKPQNIEFTTSALEHQLMVEIEHEYETNIKKYLSSLPENSNMNIVPSLRYLCSIDRKITNDLETSDKSSQNEEMKNRNCNESHDIPIKIEVDAENGEEVFNEDCKFCHVILIDYGECICMETNNLGLLLRELIGISEMKTGPIYLENCIQNDLTEEKKEEGRKWLESILENKPFQIKWKGESENFANIFIGDKFINKEVCNMGYAKLYRKCNMCGKKGHTLRECPDKIKKVKCYKCGDFGHTKKDCSVLSNDKEQPFTKDEIGDSSQDDYLKDSHVIENSHNVYSSSGNDIQFLNSTGNIMKKIIQRKPPDVCQICGNTDEMCDCAYTFKNVERNYDFKTVDKYDSDRGMAGMMAAYNHYTMNLAQDKYRDITECFPLQKYDWSPYSMMRVNPHLQSSIITPFQNPYWLTPNDLFQASEMSATILADANYHLSNKEGQVRALQEELTRIRNKGSPGLMEVMEKMKYLVDIDTILAKKIGSDEPIERALSFLNENMKHFMTTNGQLSLDDFLSETKNVTEKSKPNEQLAALKVHLEAVKGMLIEDSTIVRSRNLEKNLTYKCVFDHYYKWKVCYEKSYAKAKTYYNNTITEWITFSNDAKNILDGAPEPKKPDGADIKKFYEQASRVEWLFKESEQIIGNLPKVLITRITSIIKQLEKIFSQLEAIKLKEQEYHLSNNDESYPGITLSQYVETAKHSLPSPQVDRIVLDILEEVSTEHYNDNTFGNIHPDNIIVAGGGAKLCQIHDISSPMKIKDWKFAAPEALQGNPSKASDIYSIGKIIMWLTFCNESHTLNDQALDTIPFVKDMVHEDPTKRPSIQDILSNSLFASPPSPLPREVNKKKINVEKINRLSKIDEEFVDENQESSLENM